MASRGAGESIGGSSSKRNRLRPYVSLLTDPPPLAVSNRKREKNPPRRSVILLETRGRPGPATDRPSAADSPVRPTVIEQPERGALEPILRPFSWSPPSRSSSRRSGSPGEASGPGEPPSFDRNPRRRGREPRSFGRTSLPVRRLDRITISRAFGAPSLGQATWRDGVPTRLARVSQP